MNMRLLLIVTFLGALTLAGCQRGDDGSTASDDATMTEEMDAEEAIDEAASEEMDAEEAIDEAEDEEEEDEENGDDA